MEKATDSNFNRYLITAALPYANGLKHIGHLAGAYLPADIYVRFLKALKKDVVFVCGSDEHGTAIPIQAEREHISPTELINKYHEKIFDNFNDLGIHFDLYYRTSDQLHHQTSQEFFTHLYNNGYLIEKTTEEFYDPKINQFLADRYIKGDCPSCNYDGAFGDQCEKCGKSLSPNELINPISTLSGEKPIKKSTTHWYLPLQNYEEFLRNWLLVDKKEAWRNSVIGQCKSWLDNGLKERAITRDLNWGIKVPLQQAENKVLYVWFDAPIGYISATKQWAIKNNKNWQPYWLDKSTKLVHFIGKDNIVFHCLIFPIILHLNGYILPDNVPANEFLNLEGDKMSTSRGWSLEMETFINDWIKSSKGTSLMADVLRYYLTSIAPETKDSEFTWQGFKEANNNELVNNLGNFVNRTFVLIHKYCQGKIPKLTHKDWDSDSQFLIQIIIDKKKRIEELIHSFMFREALAQVMELSRQGNIYLQKKQPWILAKKLNDEAQEQINSCLYLCLQLIANLTIFLNPFLPYTAKYLCKFLKVVPKILDWENGGNIHLLKSGYRLPQPNILFRKIEEEEIQAQKDKLIKNLNNMNPNAPIENSNKNLDNSRQNLAEFDPLIQWDDFAKLDLRIGKIIQAEKIPNTDKLLQLQVDLGLETRTIISGLAEYFNPQDIVGQVVTVVANLSPKKMRGIESRGMILMAKDLHGKLHFVTTNPTINTGAKIS